MHTAASRTNFNQTVVGDEARTKLLRAPRIRRRSHDALSDRPIRLASDLHVGSEFLWTRTHR